MANAISPWFSETAEAWVGPAVAAVASGTVLSSQMTFVSQATQDTTISMGKSTVTANDDVTEVAQSFTADGPYISSIGLFIGKAASPTDNLTVGIYNDNSNAPGTTQIASVSIAGTALQTSPQLETATFTESSFTKPLITGVRYWIVVDRDGSASDTNYYKVNYKGTASTVASHALSRSDNDKSTWTNDASGYDLYHVVYAGDVGHRVKDIAITGGERDADAVKLLGYNEFLDKKRATIVQAAFTMVYADRAMAEWLNGPSQNVTGNYYRNIGGEKSSNDRTTGAWLFRLNDGTNVVNALLNNAVATMGELSLAADGTVEQKVTVKCLASDYYEEDDFG